MAFIIAGTWPVGIPILALIGSNYVARVLFTSECFVPIVAFAMLSLVSLLNFFGAEVSGNVQRVVVTLTVLLLSFIVVAGIPKVRSIELDVTPVDVWRSMSLIFWAYLGFENVTFLSGEFKDPKRDFFVSLLAGLACVVFLYAGLSYVVVGLLDKSHLTETTPVIEVVNKVGGSVAGLIAGVLSIFVVFINLNAWVWGASRSIYSMGRDRKLPEFLSRVNRYGSPYVAISALLIGWGLVLAAYAICNLDLAAMFRLANQNFVIMYLASVASYLKVNRGVRRLFGFATFAIVAAFMFAYGYVLIYPLILALIAVVYMAVRAGGPLW